MYLDKGSSPQVWWTLVIWQWKNWPNHENFM